MFPSGTPTEGDQKPCFFPDCDGTMHYRIGQPSTHGKEVSDPPGAGWACDKCEDHWHAQWSSDPRA